MRLVAAGGYQAPIPPLPGMTQDLEAMTDIAHGLGFRDDAIRILSGPQATRAAITEALETWLIKGVGPADRALFYYGGHGTRVKDETGDEADGLDEALVPADVVKEGGVWKGLLLDDDLGAALARIGGRAVVPIVGPGWLSLVVTIVIFSLPQFGRLARGALLSEQGREYVLAARVLGVSKAKIMTRHILPNARDPVIVQVSLSMIAGIFIEAALSIVGLGIQPPTPSLGTLLNVGIRYVYVQPVYTAGPIIMLLLLALAFIPAFAMAIRGRGEGAPTGAPPGVVME